VGTDVPDPVAIDEPYSWRRCFSTDDSPRFVNGLLGRIATIAEGCARPSDSALVRLLGGSRAS